LTLDIGTSEVKVSVFNAVGEALETNRTELRSYSSKSHWVEANPEVVWKAVSDGIRKLRSDLRSTIKCASISSHGESFVAVDRSGKPIRDIILNIDSRATLEMEDFSRTFGRQELYRRTGLPSHPMYTLPKILWMRRHEPALFAQSARFLCLEDYILTRLHIEPVISVSTASRTLGFDLESGAWDRELLSFAGISEKQVSRSEKSGVPLGTSPESIAAQLGLPAKTVWCTAGYDQACASIGAGAMRPGMISDGTGTFECASIPLENPLVSPVSLDCNLPCGRHVVPDNFLTLAYVPGGIALKWLRETLMPAGAYSYEAMLSGLPIDPTGVFCFPYFIGTGTPWLDSRAKGAIYGLTTSTGIQSLAQAMLEGVCYEMRWNLEMLRDMNIPVNHLLAAGGGAKSDAWLQLKSDIFGCPVMRVPGEASSRGAAICAAMGVGHFSSWTDAITTMVGSGRVFEPKPTSQRIYDGLFEEYKELAQRIYGHSSPRQKN
jgi:xylulokinase